MDWKQRRASFISLLQDTTALPSVLIREIIYPYWGMIRYHELPNQTFSLPNKSTPIGIASDSQSIFLSSHDHGCSLIRTDIQHVSRTISNHKREFSASLVTLTYPTGIEIDLEKKILFVIDQNDVTLLDLNDDHKIVKTISLTALSLPTSCNYESGLKIDTKEDVVYVTLWGSHQIFAFNYQSEEMQSSLKRFGAESGGSEPGNYLEPRGLTHDEIYLYICDCRNHRIQRVKKEIGDFSAQWGSGKDSIEANSFSFPKSIYCDGEYFYIGDYKSVQIWDREGVELQKIVAPNFSYVYGITKVNEELWVSDWGNGRVLIFGLEK